MECKNKKGYNKAIRNKERQKYKNTKNKYSEKIKRGVKIIKKDNHTLVEGILLHGL